MPIPIEIALLLFSAVLLRVSINLFLWLVFTILSALVAILLLTAITQTLGIPCETVAQFMHSPTRCR